MNIDDNFRQIDDKIRLLKKTAMELNNMSGNFPAVFRNSSRILSSIKMMEINVSDLIDAGTGAKS